MRDGWLSIECSAAQLLIAGGAGGDEVGSRRWLWF